MISISTEKFCKVEFLQKFQNPAPNSNISQCSVLELYGEWWKEERMVPIFGESMGKYESILGKVWESMERILRKWRNLQFSSHQVLQVQACPEAILTENCSLKEICSPLSFPSVWSPYSELQGSFPDESETFNCSIHLNLGSQSIRDENDYDAQSIWDEKITSLSNIAVTEDFSLRWHSCNQTRMRKFHAIKAGRETRSNKFHTRTLFFQPTLKPRQTKIL